MLLSVVIPARDAAEYLPVQLRALAAQDYTGDWELIVADNGSDMFITGAMDSRWNNGELNPAFHGLTADDFEVIQLGWR